MTFPSVFRQLAALSFLVATSATITLASAPPVVMKVLVVASDNEEISYQSITTYLSQIGVPYGKVILDTIEPDSAGNRLSGTLLSDPGTGHGLYQGLIVTDASLLSSADWSKLNTYATQFNVRQVLYYTYPDARWGLIPIDSGASYRVASPLNVKLTAAGTTVFSYLNPAGSIAISGLGKSGIWAYRATPTAATNESTTPLLAASDGSVLAVTHTTADGREMLALTMDNYPTLTHSLALSYGVINWVTKGVFLGSRRIYLNPQIDDMLFGNRLYAPTLPECPAASTCPTDYATGPDVKALAVWQAKLQADPLFKTFQSTFAFNGVGSTWFPETDPIFAALKDVGSAFGWMTHSWDHADLDCYSLVDGVCAPATVAESLAELDQNIAVAGPLGITNQSDSMVTPFNGGLRNPYFVQAAAMRGIHYIVTAALESSPNTGIVNPFDSSILEIPRRSPELFDDVSSPQSGVYGSWPDEYNAKYGPSSPYPFYSEVQTYSQVLDDESDKIFRASLLTYQPYPLAFHLDNMSAYDGVHSLYSDLIDTTVTKYKNLFTLPVSTLPLRDIGLLLSNRASYDASGVEGLYTPGVSVVLTTSNAGRIPVTGACSQLTCDTYGGQLQDSVSMAANSTATLYLTAGQGVTVSSLDLTPPSVAGGVPSSGTITLGSPAPAGGVSVILASDSASASVPAFANIAAGSTSTTFVVTTSAVTATMAANISVTYNGATRIASLEITKPLPTLSSIALAPAIVEGGTSASGSITLSSPAPSGGAAVALSSSSANAAVPASVTVPAGSTTATFSITTLAVSSSVSTIVTASYNGVSKTSSLTVTPVPVTLSSTTLNTTNVTGGTSATGTITLSGPAPSGGVSVALSSSSANAAVPASVTVSAGSTTAKFSITTKAVTASAAVTFVATYNGITKTASLTLSPAAAMSSLSLNPSTVKGGTSSIASVTLTAPAPAGGAKIALKTSNTSVTSVPLSITIPAGSSSGTFTVTTRSFLATWEVTITSTYNAINKSATLTVTR